MGIYFIVQIQTGTSFACDFVPGSDNSQQTTAHQPIRGWIDINMSLVHINSESDAIKANVLVAVCGN